MIVDSHPITLLKLDNSNVELGIQIDYVFVPLLDHFGSSYKLLILVHQLAVSAFNIKHLLSNAVRKLGLDSI